MCQGPFDSLRDGHDGRITEVAASGANVIGLRTTQDRGGIARQQGLAAEDRRTHFHAGRQGVDDPVGQTAQSAVDAQALQDRADERPERHVFVVRNGIGLADGLFRLQGEQEGMDDIIDVGQIDAVRAVTDLGQPALTSGSEQPRQQRRIPRTEDGLGPEDHCRESPEDRVVDAILREFLGQRVDAQITARIRYGLGRLVQIPAVEGHARRRDVDQPANLVSQTARDDVAGAPDIDGMKVGALSPRGRQGGDVENRCDPGTGRRDRDGIADVCPTDIDAGDRQFLTDAFIAAQDADPMAVRQEGVHQVSAQETCPPRDENTHEFSSPCKGEGPVALADLSAATPWPGQYTRRQEPCQPPFALRLPKSRVAAQGAFSERRCEVGSDSGTVDWLSGIMNVVGRWHGYVPEPQARRIVARLRRRLSQGSGWVLGINGGSHGAGVALVRIEGGEASLILNAEEERWSRRKHEWGFPTHAIEAALSTLASYGAGPDAIEVVACGWDFATFAANFFRELVSGFPHSLGLLRDTGFLDLDVIRTLPRRLARQVGRRDTAVLPVPHHDAHAWGSLLLSPFHGEGEPVLVLVADGMGDAASLSVYLARDGSVPERIATNDSLFDSLGLMYQVLSSTQGGWTPLSSEGRYMGAAAWGQRDRAANPFYSRLRPLLSLEPEGRLRLNRQWMRWHRTPDKPYGAPLAAVLGQPLRSSQLWNPDAVLDPDRTDVPALTQERLDKAAAIQLLFEDGLAHVLDHWLAATGARRLVWTGGTALNCVASLHLMERYADWGFQLWVPPFPGDNGIAAGAALRLTWKTGCIRRVRPLQHAFLGGEVITTSAIEAALVGAPVTVRRIAADSLGDHLAQLICDGAFVGLAQGSAETGPRALGHRSILADPTRVDALERMNVHVKRRERIRPLAPMVSAEAARALFELPPGSEHHDLAAWVWMVLCARARPGTAALLPAVVHVDGTARLQIVDARVNSLVGSILDGMRRRKGVAALVNTSLNVGEPIAHTAKDVVRTLFRAKDLHYVVLVGEDGQGWVVARADRQEG